MPMCVCTYTAPFSKTRVPLLKDQNTLKFLWNKFIVIIIIYYKSDDHLRIVSHKSWWVHWLSSPWSINLILLWIPISACFSKKLEPYLQINGKRNNGICQKNKSHLFPLSFASAVSSNTFWTVYLACFPYLLNLKSKP
jgi:hypothetical protein